MTRLLLAATALGALTGLALTYGTGGAVGVAVCAAAVIAWYGVRAVMADRERMRRYRAAVWQQHIDEARVANPHLTIIKGGKEPNWLKQAYPYRKTR